MQTDERIAAAKRACEVQSEIIRTIDRQRRELDAADAAAAGRRSELVLQVASGNSGAAQELQELAAAAATRRTALADLGTAHAMAVDRLKACRAWSTSVEALHQAERERALRADPPPAFVEIDQFGPKLSHALTAARLGEESFINIIWGIGLAAHFKHFGINVPEPRWGEPCVLKGAVAQFTRFVLAPAEQRCAEARRMADEAEAACQVFLQPVPQAAA